VTTGRLGTTYPPGGDFGSVLRQTQHVLKGASKILAAAARRAIDNWDPPSAPPPPERPAPQQQVLAPRIVPSLLDAMQDGREYESIVSLLPSSPHLNDDLQRALADLQSIRGRKCICYAANMIRSIPETGIVKGDHLPFTELVAQVDPAARNVDVLIVTPGGDGHQVTQFVTALRPRFDDVHFIIPYMAMSAGTLWALSGNKIWMMPNAFIGPIDPQVPSAGGRLVPYQSLLALVRWVQAEISSAQAAGQQPPAILGALIGSIDMKELGDAITATRWSEALGAEYLERYKFHDWPTHRTRAGNGPVTPAEKKQRAQEVAALLASNERWKAHGHAIDRQTARDVLRIEVDHPDATTERAIRRLWGLLHWIFDRGAIAKAIFSENYIFVRNAAVVVQQGAP
jgi:hypothetical protein